MIPGSNILNQALTVIWRQTITYYKASSRVLNSVGQDVTIYDPPVSIVGSFQPVQRSLYAQYGLDFQKNYFNFYTSNNLIDITRNVSADQISFDGIRYQCESATKWFALDGWVALLCCGITDPAEEKEQPIFGFGNVDYDNNNKNYDNGNFQDNT